MHFGNGDFPSKHHTFKDEGRNKILNISNRVPYKVFFGLAKKKPENNEAALKRF